MNITFRPIQAWPRKMTSTRSWSRFDSSYEQTFDLLERELKAINARNVVLQLALTDADIRRDGKPRASAKPSHPGVILTFEKGIFTGVWKYETISMPCDNFTTWMDNLRGIALSLEALRKIDRYGVTQSGEQYTGFAALPASSDAMTREEAAAFIAEHAQGDPANWLLVDPAKRRNAIRAAKRATHPDNGGSNELFLKLKDAVEILEKTT